MKRVFAACLISGALGALLSFWSVLATRPNEVTAQEPPRGSPPSRFQFNDEPRPADNLPPPAAPQSDQLPPGFDELTPEELVNVRVYEKANRSVVNITTKVYTPEMFFSLEGPSDGAGSGSVLDKNGHILTNHHVIEGATEIHVTLFDGRSYDANLIGRDPLSDIAVLRIAAPEETLFPIDLGDSSLLRVGQKVLAIGNPFGLERTLTVGTLSSLNRRISSKTPMRSMIQIDAALNRGNSGGPLLNSQGRMIGMNTAILSPTGQNIGVGFALPVNTIKRVIPQLIEHGRVIRPVTGIASVYEADSGLLITELTPGGPAERAGLRSYVVRRREKKGPFIYENRYFDRSHADTIIAVNGKEVATGDALQTIVDALRPGDEIIITVIRDGRPLDVPLVLGSSE